MFIPRSGSRRERRTTKLGLSISKNEAADPSKLAEILKSIIRALDEVDKDNYIEFEVDVSTGGGLVYLEHRFNGPVRYYVVDWTRIGTGAYPTAAPVLVRDGSSTANRLVLRSHVAGRAVIRVERAQVSGQS